VAVCVFVLVKQASVLVKQVKQVLGPLVGDLSLQHSCNRAATELQQSMQLLVKQVTQVLGPLVGALSHALRGEFASVAIKASKASTSVLVKQVKQVLGPPVEALSHALRGEFAFVAARSPWTRGQSAVALLQQHLSQLKASYTSSLRPHALLA
jgi:hypothetical protein